MTTDYGEKMTFKNENNWNPTKKEQHKQDFDVTIHFASKPLSGVREMDITLSSDNEL